MEIINSNSNLYLDCTLLDITVTFCISTVLLVRRNNETSIRQDEG